MDDIRVSDTVLSSLPIQQIKQELDGWRNIPIRQGEDGDEEIVNELLESSLCRQQPSQVDLWYMYEGVLI